MGKGLQLAGFLSLLDKLASNRLRARDDKARIGVPQAALNGRFLDEGELLLYYFRPDQPRPRSERPARGDLSPDFIHTGIVADPRHFQPSDALVVAELFVEFERVQRSPARQEVMAGHVAEVRGVSRRADIGRNA